MIGVTQLGTSYDFNKLKKGLDSVQHRNNAGSGLIKQKSTSSQKTLKAKELSKTAKVEEPIKLEIEKDPNPDTENPNTGKVEGEVKKEEEVIIFSDNHSLEDYIVGRQIG